MRKFATFNSEAGALSFCSAIWDLVRTLRPRITDLNQQTWIGTGFHVSKEQTVARRLAVPRKHPTLDQWAVVVDKPGDCDVEGLINWLVARPGVLTLLDNGSTIEFTLPGGETGSRTNYFWANTQTATQARWDSLKNKVDAAASLTSDWISSM